ncbi:hypothetical protein C8Q74DRAFT_1030405 [Fomes fomentarius]|nr:hypothetical protein C8Q74DRAFT_1030405 [Fomes fomentarius]
MFVTVCGLLVMVGTCANSVPDRTIVPTVTVPTNLDEAQVAIIGPGGPQTHIAVSHKRRVLAMSRGMPVGKFRLYFCFDYRQNSYRKLPKQMSTRSYWEHMLHRRRHLRLDSQ